MLPRVVTESRPAGNRTGDIPKDPWRPTRGTITPPDVAVTASQISQMTGDSKKTGQYVYASVLYDFPEKIVKCGWTRDWNYQQARNPAHWGRFESPTTRTTIILCHLYSCLLRLEIFVYPATIMRNCKVYLLHCNDIRHSLVTEYINM